MKIFDIGKAVLTSTHNLCFGAKIRQIDIPLHTPVWLYKSGVQGGIHFTDMLCESGNYLVQLICLISHSVLPDVLTRSRLK